MRGMKVVCFGDSLTSCGGAGGRFSDILQDRFPGHTFVNRGEGGETIADGALRLSSDVLEEHADIVLVEFGANDWWRDERPPEAWGQDLEQVVVRIKEAGAVPMILGVFGPYLDESGARAEKKHGSDERGIAYREIEQRVAARHECAYIPNIQERIIGRRCCWRDTNHPNEYGNRSVADSIEPMLEDLLGSRAAPVRKPNLQTTRDMWLETVRLAPDRLAVVDGTQRLTYAEADRLVRQVSCGLQRVSGVARPTVAVHLPNCLEYYLAYWATVRLGGVIVPLNTWLTAENLAAIFRNVRPELLIVQSPQNTTPLGACRAAAPAAVIAIEGESHGICGWASLLGEEDDASLPDVETDALSVVMHTSGTTGTPKGAMMRHSDLLFNVMTTINAHQFSIDDVHLLVNRMFHCTALYSSLPTAAYTKTPVVIATPTDPRALMELVESEGITTFLSVPSVLQQLLKVKQLERYDASSLRLMAYAGSPMPVRTIRELQDQFPNVALHNFLITFRC